MTTSRMKLVVLVAGLSVVAGGVGWRLARATAPAADVEPVAVERAAAGGDAIADLQRQLRTLQDEQARTRAQLDQALNANESSKKEPPVKDQAPPPTAEELRRQDYERSKHVADYVQRVLENESMDVAWASSRVQEIRESFKDFKLDGFALADADCRATLCKVTIERAPNGITQELGGAIVQLAPFKKMGAFFHYEDDRVILYSPREGHAFPQDPASAKP